MIDRLRSAETQRAAARADPRRGPHVRQGRRPVPRGPGVRSSSAASAATSGTSTATSTSSTAPDSARSPWAMPTPVIEAARRAMEQGTNFARPAAIELEAAEALARPDRQRRHGQVRQERLRRDDGGRPAGPRRDRSRLVAIVRNDQPFFSTDDWFIGHDVHARRRPGTSATVHGRFPYNDLDALEALLREHPGAIACVVLEAGDGRRARSPASCRASAPCATRTAPLLVLDEMITGFRWHARGAAARVRRAARPVDVRQGAGQRLLRVRPERAPRHHGARRRSTTTPSASSCSRRPMAPRPTALAAAIEVMRIYRDEGVAERLHERGDRLRAGVEAEIAATGVGDRFQIVGPLVQPRVRDARPGWSAFPAVPDPVPPGAHRPRDRGTVAGRQRGPHRRRSSTARRRRSAGRCASTGERSRRASTATCAGVPSSRCSGRTPEFG